MDEILIEEKKYVSSKRAARMTGYAKDYIGQLCREGRVPARLVGRSWYVLETAIQDHRFGATGTQPGITERDVQPEPSPTWEPPRYKSSEDEPLPSVNRLQYSFEHPSAENANSLMPEGIDGRSDVSQHLQDSWRAWFDRVADAGLAGSSTAPNEHPISSETDEKDQEIKTMKETEEEGVNVPVRAIYELPPENLLPRHFEAESSQGTEDFDSEPEKGEKRPRRGVIGIIKIASIFIAVLLSVLAIIGSGYFDKYIVSDNQANIFSGIIMYNK